MAIPSFEQWKQSELRRASEEIDAAGDSTLSDKRLSELNMLEDVDSGCRRILDAADHLSAGNYGVGHLFALKNLTKRMNRRAWLWSRIGALEFGLDVSRANKLWHNVPEPMKTKINEEFDECLRELDEGERGQVSGE